MNRDSVRRKTVALIFFFSAASLLHLPDQAQNLQHQVGVINIEVPVRVFKGDRFIDHLKLEDFELFEDGRLQSIESVYLIHKTSVEKSQGRRSLTPMVSRHFILMFEITEYLPKVGDAIDHFFENVLLPGDSLNVVTPLKTYRFKPDALTAMPRPEISRKLKDLLIKDARLGNTEYWSLIRDLRDVMNTDDFLEVRLERYQQILGRLTGIRYVDEGRLLEFARYLRDRSGQKHVFLFYQKELIPQINYRELMELESNNQGSPDMIMKLNELFNFYKRDVDFDVDRVKKAFSDSSIAVHFMLITQQRPKMGGLTRDMMTMEEHSEDIFSAFSEMAQATGGLVVSSANAASSFEKAVDASENYYLIYYSPTDYKADNVFRKITVKVKTGNYRVSHRAGYISD